MQVVVLVRMGIMWFHSPTKQRHLPFGDFDLNPLTYGINAIRGVLLGYEIASVPFNLAVLLAFTVVMLVLAIWMSGKEV
jgi:ABC-type polysaccharide/polyol phosphate export permease